VIYATFVITLALPPASTEIGGSSAAGTADQGRVGLVLGFRPDGGVLLSVGLLLVFSVGLSWIWTALGLVLRTPNLVMGVRMLVLFPSRSRATSSWSRGPCRRGWRR